MFFLFALCNNLGASSAFAGCSDIVTEAGLLNHLNLGGASVDMSLKTHDGPVSPQVAAASFRRRSGHRDM